MISSDTLLRWLKQGKITAKTSPSGTCQRHRLGCQLLKTLLERTSREIIWNCGYPSCRFAFELIECVLSPHYKTHGSLQRISTNFPGISLRSTLSSSIECKEKSCSTKWEEESQCNKAPNEDAQKKLLIVHY